MRPEQNGTKKLFKIFGKNLVAVRYYRNGSKRFKTVELIVALRKIKRK